VRLHETLARFAAIVRRYEVIQYEVEGLHVRLKVRVFLVDESQLHVRETVLSGQRRKYAYHWQDQTGRLRIRWDNAAHWPEIETHPHHKHVGNEHSVTASEATILEEVLAVIRAQIAREQDRSS
jgi:Family of unknown function (DUF6516)